MTSLKVAESVVVPLSTPPKNFNTLHLPTREVRVDKLRRVSGHASGEPYFGKKGLYRFDDPKNKYGTCYLGLDLDTAVAESVLHDQMPDNGTFEVAQSVMDCKHLVKIAPNAAGHKLVVADLTGANLKRLGGDNAISSEVPYDQCQKWSAAVHAHPANVDGIMFVSRQLNDKKAVILFNRAASKLGAASYTKLAKARGLAKTMDKLGIKVVLP